MEYKTIEDLLASNVYTFGSYKIQGCLALISSVTSENINSLLYYHFETNKFLLVKKFKSGKYHIDFMDRVDMKDILYSRNNTLTGEVVDVAEAHQKDHSKFLSYDSVIDAYIITSVFELKRFETIYRKEIWSDK